MGLKIVHCADLHFDTPFSGLDTAGKAAIRKEDLRQVFGKIIALVKEEKADILIISGDLFDQSAVSSQTISYILDKLAEIKDTKVFLSAGNHDPKTPKSYYNIIDWGSHVHIFDTQMERIPFNDFDIYGISFSHGQCNESLLTGFRAVDLNKINIMAMHADFNVGTYNPVTKDEIKNSGLDYLALGHIHKFSGAIPIGDTLCAYPGCPEGRGFDELGEKGVIVAEIEKGNINLRFVPLCKRTYYEIMVDISGLAHYEAICSRILLNITGTRDDLYKIVLTGETDLTIDEHIILDALDYFMVKVVDKTVPKVDYNTLAEELNLKGLFVKNMLDEIEKAEDKQLYQQALDYGLAAILGEKVKPD